MRIGMGLVVFLKGVDVLLEGFGIFALGDEFEFEFLDLAVEPEHIQAHPSGV